MSSNIGAPSSKAGGNVAAVRPEYHFISWMLWLVLIAASLPGEIFSLRIITFSRTSLPKRNRPAPIHCCPVIFENILQHLCTAELAAFDETDATFVQFAYTTGTHDPACITGPSLPHTTAVRTTADCGLTASRPTVTGKDKRGNPHLPQDIFLFLQLLHISLWLCSS